MDAILSHLNENKFIYSILGSIICMAALYSLSRYFATKKELASHAAKLTKHIEAFEVHRAEHLAVRDMVRDINQTIKHLPSAEESIAIRENMATLNGRLEGMEPLLKQILSNQTILIENEIRGDKA